MGIFTFRNLLEHYPLRHIDKTIVSKIRDIGPSTDFIQVAGTITNIEIIGARSAKRMVAELKDNTGYLELVWFQGINWIQKILQEGKDYLVYGRVGFFNGKPQISHPEIELKTESTAEGKNYLEPVYPTTEKLKAKSLNGRQIGKLTDALLPQLSEKDIPENIPETTTKKLKLVNRFKAYCNIHFPKNLYDYNEALKRLKFEELFLAQIRLQLAKLKRHRNSKGVVFEKVLDLFNDFYNHYLPFELTGAQKRVLKEIRTDTAMGHQMNRLLQGDVGSGKTIVALLCMLLAADNGYQSCMMAPTEILAKQHYDSLKHLLKDMPVNIRLLTGSSRSLKEKKFWKIF